MEKAVVPAPTPLIQRGHKPPAGGDQERHVFCVYYQECLGKAVKAGWDAWTCRRCALRIQASQGLKTREFAEQRTRGWND
jgi:hypothetical protein